MNAGYKGRASIHYLSFYNMQAFEFDTAHCEYQLDSQIKYGYLEHLLISVMLEYPWEQAGINVEKEPECGCCLVMGCPYKCVVPFPGSFLVSPYLVIKDWKEKHEKVKATPEGSRRANLGKWFETWSHSPIWDVDREVRATLPGVQLLKWLKNVYPECAPSYYVWRLDTQAERYNTFVKYATNVRREIVKINN